MAWDVRPTADLDEFKRAVGAIGHYFGGWPPDDESAQRFSSNLPLERMHAAFDGDRIVAHRYSARPARCPSKMARSAGTGPNSRTRLSRSRPASSSIT